MSDRPVHFFLADEGRVLASRRRGRVAAERLRELAGDKQDLVLDFDGVEAVTPPFVQEVLDAVHAILSGDRDSGRLVVAANLNEDVVETLALVLERRKSTLAYRIGDKVDLLHQTAPHLLDVLREAQKLRTFTAAELAERLDIQVNALHQRLKPLLEAGAIGRERDPESSRGVRHRYRVVAPDEPATEREPVPA